MDTGRVHHNGEPYADFEREEAEQEVQRPSLPKRQRVTTNSTQVIVRKKQVRGKQGRLAGLVGVPIDIFTEVASYLLPGDVISLSRSNKFFRHMLMHRSAIHIWHGVMKNVTGLPACPTGISEPHYLALLFSKTCSMCGDPARTAMDPALLVRLCGSCRNIHLMPWNAVPPVVKPWVHFSRSSAPPKHRSSGLYTLREEVSTLLVQYKTRECSNDKSALEAWAKERSEIKNTRHSQAVVINRFLNALEQDRKQEIVDIKVTRQSEIKRRLTEMGWTEKDMEFCWWSDSYNENLQNWDGLVFQAKPLSDRIWANIEPKLTTMLEANRKERSDLECEWRKYNRRSRLSELFFETKQKASVLNLKVSSPFAWLSSTMSTIGITYREPFPDFVHTLNWPLVKDLYETDRSEEEMEARFVEKQDEIKGLVRKWQNQIQSQLANRLRDEYTSQGGIVRPTIAIINEDPNELTNVSDDLKLLLRADSLFRKTTSCNLKQPYLYGTILSAEGLAGSSSTHHAVFHRATANLDHFHWYPEAHEAARDLLADMGIPDASYPEMEGLGSRFVCGRCREAHDRDWKGIVQHYVEQKELYSKIQEHIARSDSGIIYSNIHDPALLVNQPMVVDRAVKSFGALSETEIGWLQICRVCEMIPVAGKVIARESDILKHLLDVHGITEPQVNEHYVPNIFGSELSGPGNRDSDDNHPTYHGYDHSLDGMLDEDNTGSFIDDGLE